MNSLRFILASLSHYRRIHLAVGLGVAVATAVLTGALLVGDSVRGSLQDLTLERLGRISEVLVSGPMFRDALATELMSDPGVRENFSGAEPAILTTGTLQAGRGQSVQRATQLSVLGCQSGFWSFGEGGPAAPLADGEVAITRTVAEQLGAKVGDSVLLRVPAVGVIPPDSALGKKSVDKTTKAKQFKVAAVLEPKGLARFGLQPSQHLPRTVFLPLESLQTLLGQAGKANVILVAGHDLKTPTSSAQSDVLQMALRPQLADYGLRVEPFESPATYTRISSDQLVLRNEIVDKIDENYDANVRQPVVTYLANTISVGEGNSRRKIPYSTITGVESKAGIGPVFDVAGEPVQVADGEIVLNRWAADDLKANIGDQVTITFYEPESQHGALVEHVPVTFRLKAIAELKRADGKPTPAADPNLTPELPGVTDRGSIRDWDMPFKLVETIRDADEKYWDDYRTTPKAFVSLATAKRLWGSRWGTISLERIPLADGDAASSSGQIAERLRAAIRPADLGLSFIPIKNQGLEAAGGTTPFDGLFLGFSFFLITSAVMLIALLFQLGVAERADELGILSAVGIGRKRAARLLASEGLVVSVVGAAIGAIAGVGYAWLMIAGLRTWWVAAVATPFLQLHIWPPSLFTGWIVGVVVSWLTIRWSIRRLVRLPVGRLLAGQVEVEGGRGEEAGGRDGILGGYSRWLKWPSVRWGLVVLTILLCASGFWLQGEAQAGSFFGSGALVLTLLLGEIRYRLKNAPRSAAISNRGFSLAGLSRFNIARHPGRSALNIGLVASASFLIVAMSAFQLTSNDEGTGKFELLATSDQPINYDLNTPSGREELGFSEDESDALAKWRIFSLRVHAGEDASCLNLYKPSQPTVLGVPLPLISRGGFELVKSDLPTSLELEVVLPDPDGNSPPPLNPWAELLTTTLGKDENERLIIPVVLDANTATYSLKLGGIGAQFSIDDEAGRPMTLQVVNLLKNSMLQGKLLVSETNFNRMYPSTSGFRFFLLEPRSFTGGEPTSAATVSQLIETRLSDEGFDATPAREELAEFLAVQNTYLSTFQSLGALGLLLGTVGLAVVQLRSVLERRGELALMRAGGFRRGRLVRMVLWENAVLLVGGLAVGCIAAAVALLPQWAPQSASVPWRTLLVLLGTIAAVGLAAGWLATRTALRAPIVPALRGD